MFVHPVLILLLLLFTPSLGFLPLNLKSQKVVAHGCAVHITLPAVHDFAAVWEVSGERCWLRRGRKMFSRSFLFIFFYLLVSFWHLTAFIMGGYISAVMLTLRRTKVPMAFVPFGSVLCPV